MSHAPIGAPCVEIHAAPLSTSLLRNHSCVETKYEHVILGEDRLPIVAGATMKITELVPDKIAHGWSPEELQFQHTSS